LKLGLILKSYFVEEKMIRIIDEKKTLNFYKTAFLIFIVDSQLNLKAEELY